MAGLIVEGAAPRADCFRVGVGLRLRIWLPRSCGDGENDRFNPLMSGGGAYDAACVCADMEEPVEGRERDGEGGGSSIAVPALSSRIFFFNTGVKNILTFLCAALVDPEHPYGCALAHCRWWRTRARVQRRSAVIRQLHQAWRGCRSGTVRIGTLAVASSRLTNARPS